MDWALIKAGIVVNCIVAGQDFINAISSQYDAVVQYPDGTYVGPGFSYDPTQPIPNCFIAPPSGD